MISLGKRIVMNDVSIKIDTDLSIEEIREQFISYVVDNGFLYNTGKEEFEALLKDDYVLDSKEEIFFSNGEEDILYGVLFQAFCVNKGIKITDFSY